MLEGLAAWVINNYLGKYVENLNTDQLSIALLQGAVELENLPLRKDALRHIGLPIEVRAGFIGKVKLQIPIAQITSAPWEISIEKLYVVAGPIRLSELDEEAEEQALLDYKLSLLDGIEACWRSETEADTSYYASSYSSWLGLSMSFATNIIENLQLKIKDVHLRYEDNVTIQNEIFAGGIKIESLTGTSCDETWTPKYISCNSSNESFKLLEMTGFSIYWDRITEDELCCDLELTKLAERMSASAKLNHDYVLSPVSSQAKMKRNRSEQPLRSRHQPRIVCDLTLQQVPLILLDWQYSQIVRCKRGLEWLDGRRGHLRSRPRCSPSEDPSAWWRYATSRLMVHSRLSTWSQVLTRAKENVAYVAIHTKLLSNSVAITPLTEEEKSLKDKVEWALDFDHLRVLRELAMSRVRPPASINGTPVSGKNQEGLSLLARWFPGWWGWQTAPGEGIPPLQQAQTSQLDHQILDVLADTVENNTLLKRDTIFGQFNFSLNKGKLHLCQKTGEPLLELEFENVTLGYESRPRTTSHSFNITLGAIYLKDHLTKDSCFPVLISPQSSGIHGRNLPPGIAKLFSQATTTPSKEEPLFKLTYEFKPFGSNVDNRLVVSSKSLDVVYNPNVMRWIVEFFTGPYFDPSLRRAARKGYHAMKMKTKQQLFNNWENILQGNMTNRKTWDLELNISAPQILLVEHFNDKDAVLCLVDFGKLLFTNRMPDHQPIASPPSVETEDEDGDFQTPCSTPPGSISEDLIHMETPNMSPTDPKLCENILHNRLYDRYTLNFCDLQILVGKVRDNWKFAHLKGTSTLHVLDKFNISLQIERRVVFTIDPQFPSLTVSGNLPKLVAHVNEQKVCALKILTDVALGKGLISPLRSQDPSPVEEVTNDKFAEDVPVEPDSLDTSARLVMLQFCVDQMALEVQSRGRSVAELQVNGVKLSFTKRPFDTSLSLSVHGLLLVDALQNYGQDFELLVASHKHVGMDTLSGSLQDSEPTSPTSPASPEPKLMPTSPIAISQALSSLSQSSINIRVKSPIGSVGPSSMKIPLSTELPDSEALITVELLFVSADCPTNSNAKEHLQVANIQFNNLDIIANQETIVELMGFVKRVFPQEHSTRPVVIQPPTPDGGDEIDGRDSGIKSPFGESQVTRTQVTFDFHRLNVLLLRAVVRESGIVAKKIATATMSEAKIHANIGKCIEVEGSLGGLQVLDLAPGCLHQRIISIGEDPLTNSTNAHTTLHLLTSMARDMYAMSRDTTSPHKDTQAFSFSIKRTPLNHETDVAEISVRMASVWYVHSPKFLSELKSCAAEFKQYLSNLARSISSAATEVAMGLMHARTESLAQSLSMGGRLYGSSGDISQAPRRFRSISYSQDFMDFSKGTNTPHSPADQNLWTTLIKWDVVLASPVVVLPRNPLSPQVVVGHLGGINITNSEESPVSSPWGPPSNNIQKFTLQIRDINLYTVDISNRVRSASNINESVVLPADKLYSSSWDSKPVLHDTNIHLTVTRQIGHVQNRSEEILLDGQDMSKLEYQENIQVNGKVVTKLKLSVSRHQYEQLIETLDSCLSEVSGEADCPSAGLADIVEGVELHTGVSTLSLDPALRARMVMRPGLPRPDNTTSETKPPPMAISVSFELPELTMELMADVGIGEQGLVDLSFKDLIIAFDKSYKSEVNIQVSLRSVTMEDLQKPLDSKYRWLMSSSNSYSARPDLIPNFYSRSCPELTVPGGHNHGRGPWHCSLPDHLETEHVLGAMSKRHKHILAVENTLEKRRKGSDTKCPYTPPPSPRGNISPPLFHEDNLVHVNVSFKPSLHPSTNNTRHMTVDFNSLDVIVNVESWLVVLDFFGISDIEQEQVKEKQPTNDQQPNVSESSQSEETDSVLVVSVRSLSLLLNRAEYEVARATMSQLKARLVTSVRNQTTETDASVGSFTLTDLTPVHSTLYRHRFITAGLKLNMIKHNSPDRPSLMSPDYELKMEMTSLVYAHTQRYVAELQAFFRLFPHLRKRIGYTKGNEIMEDDENTISTRVLLELSAVSPIILLPMSSVSHSVLIADLGNLKVSNQLLMSSSPATIGSSSDPARDILLDVMSIQLESMDIFTGERKMDISPSITNEMISVGSYYVERKGTALLREKCHLRVHVERNLMPALHCVPDLSIQGTLSTLAANLTLSDYKLISGLLSFNIGESLDDISPQPEIIVVNSEADIDMGWTCTSLRFELVDVNVQLLPTENTSLACINFIKSILLIETYSNRTQDIDLVSEEILITDTRFADQPANKRSNVFTNILQPIHMISDCETVQAQVHHRKRLDLSKFTILLNNMKLMAILDWWESVQNFILTKPDYIPPVPNVTSIEPEQVKQDTNIPFELKLNITDSEIVVVENTAQWDSNAVILKSTTVITYRPLEIDKPVSCNLNHCEMFSCILGMEEETALSIIDPVTVNMDILTRQTADGVIYKVLKAQMVHLSLRLSYHDVKMFNQMLRSLPKQTHQARNQLSDSQPVNLRNQLDKLEALGFDPGDCQQALSECSGKLDDAALWLTLHAAPIAESPRDLGSPHHSSNNSPFSINCVEVFTDSASLCIIDDCRDADVPLMELSLSNLDLKHNLDNFSGSCTSVLSAHYYNRLLSGWEPFIEPWKYSLCWDYTLSFAVTKTRLELHVASADSLNINITNSLVDLYKSVRDTWTDDYYNPKDSVVVRGDMSEPKMVTSPPGYRRRSPFVPFALHNDTGSRIWYATVIATADNLTDRRLHSKINEQNHEWVLVEHGTIAPFSFNEQGKRRHRDTHKLRTHQICIRVEGWSPVGPVTVDKVGVYFRQASPDYQMEKDLMQARIVLEVTLEGSARKLITVRSALQIANQLSNAVEIKLDNPRLQNNRYVHLIIPPEKSLSIPMLYTNSSIWARPLDAGPPAKFHAFCSKPLNWQDVSAPNQVSLETRFCHANNSNTVYRFCVSVKRENYPSDRTSVYSVPLSHPAHTLTLFPPLTLVNLLPYELHASINKESTNRIKPGAQLTVHQVDLDNRVELKLHLDNFPHGGTIEIPCGSVNFTGRVKLHDHSNRRLYLQVNAAFDPSTSLRVNVAAPFWFINKTALPIVFKQEGVATETAGQYEEHEIARMIAPLLFSTSSFSSDSDNCPTVVARIGSAVHQEGVPQWCSSLSLQCGVKMRRLRVALKQNRPDIVYMIGVEIRPGRGRYRNTKIVTLSALFQIHNKSSFKLQFAQKCFATTVNDPGAQSTYLTTVANCSLPFHWPRLDKDQLLCVRILDIPDCLWSGGFKIDDNNSFHLNIRDNIGRMYFLRIEIVLQGATYFILATDADTMPPPIRLDNYSLVALQFHQIGLTNLSHVVKAQSSVPYAWDEPTSPPILTVTAPGGISASYDLEKLGDGPLLTYENFIYIAFAGTFASSEDGHILTGGLELVLDVPDPSTGKVVLSRKQQGARSQLWRMTPDGLLQHEGSSPPRAPADKILVLDICGPAPQPTQYVGLILRRPDKRRSCTQSWKFTEEGRLCCAHSNMCVQAKDGFFGLRSGSGVVLGPPQPVCFQTTDLGVPLEQAVCRQKLRPGSGCLAVKVTSDGPTRILKIIDLNEKKRFCLVSETGWVNIASSQRPHLDSAPTPSIVQEKNEMQLSVDLPKVGISLVSQDPPEELVFITLGGIRFSSLVTPSSEIFDISIQDIQIDNQQFDAQCPVVFFVTPTSRSSDPDEAAKPVISITAERTPTKKTVNADIYKYLLGRIKSISVIIDERLALKLFVFAGLNQEEEIENTDESDFETQRILAEAASVHAKRYYFDSLKLIFTQVRLSVITSSKLNKRLLSMKRKLGWTLIRFEDAAIELEPFTRQYSFETGQFLWNSVLKHYKNEMKWQAGIILGSVDFLGNPLGFMNDVSEGFTGLIYEGNLGALVRNVAHGLSNSTAKFTETLGDGLGRVSLDESYEETRQRIRRVQTGSSGDHLMAGLKGLGFGLLGGVTSLFRQSYDGAAADGLPGFISGFGKGIVGTVTKPVVGVLDLASETASAVRDSSKSSSKQIPNKKRLTRCVISPTGFLPMYNMKQSLGQQFLYNINGRNFKELFMAYEVLRSGCEDLRIVISSNSIRIFSCSQSNSDPTIVVEKNLSELLQCTPVSHPGSLGDQLHYIELLTRIETSGGPGVPGIDPVKRPRVRCDSETIASWVSQQVNYAKAQFVERQHTLVHSSDSLQED